MLPRHTPIFRKMVNCDLNLEREMGYIPHPPGNTKHGKDSCCMITQLVITKRVHKNIGLLHKESSRELLVC